MNCKIMKKTLIYIASALFVAAAFASCDKNEYPVFDDKDAFVAFDEVEVSVSEKFSEGGAIKKIPVTLASVAGLEEVIKFDIVYPDTKAAQEGVNYELLTTSKTLSFNAENRTQYIEFKTIYDGIYTGDLKFTIVIYGNEDIVTGSESECVITLTDEDHPLGFMLGDYTVTGEDNWAGVTTWTMTLTKDEKDDHKVWIKNLANWSNSKAIAYGNVSEDFSTLNIPFGQEFEYAYDGVTKSPLWGVYGEGYLAKSGSVDVKIIQDGGKITLDFGDQYGFAIPAMQNGAAAGYFAIIWPGIVAEKN